MKLSKKIIALVLSVAIIGTGSGISTMANTMGARENDVVVEEQKEVKVVKELKSKRTKNSNTYLMSDGTKKLEVYAGDIRYKEDGTWKNYDRTLKDLSNEEAKKLENIVLNGKKEHEIKVNDYIYVNSKGDSKQYFGSELNEEHPVVMNKDDYSISFAPIMSEAEADDNTEQNSSTVAKISVIQETVDNQSLAVQPDTSLPLMEVAEQNDQISYSDTEKSIEYSYTSLNNGVKEDIILYEKPDTNIFEYKYETIGLEAVVFDDNTIFLVDKNTEEAVAQVSAPYVMDVQGNKSYDDVKIELKEESDGVYIVKVKVEEEYLADSTRYPVTIDPVVSWDCTNIYTRDEASSMSTGMPGTYRFITGVDEEGYEKITYLSCTNAINQIKGKYIEYAIFMPVIYDIIGEPVIKVKNIESSWSFLKLNTDEPPQLSEKTYKSYNAGIHQSGSSMSLYITDMIQELASENMTSYGIALKTENENNGNVVTFYGYAETSEPIFSIGYSEPKDIEATYNGKFSVNGEFADEGKIELSWDKYNEDVDKYHVYVRENSGDFKFEGTTTGLEYSYAISDDIETVDIRVMAVDPNHTNDVASENINYLSDIISFEKLSETSTDDEGNETTSITYGVTTFDTDGDELEDGYEIWDFKTLWNTETSESTTYNKVYDLDTDNDGLPDSYEVFTLGTDPTIVNEEDLDSDGDKLTDLEEYKKGTDPYLTDSDFDGVNDKADSTPRKTNNQTNQLAAANAEIHIGKYEVECTTEEDGIFVTYIYNIYEGTVKSVKYDYGDISINRTIKYFYDGTNNTAIIETYDQDNTSIICTTFTYDDNGNVIFICDQKTKYSLSYDEDKNISQLKVGNTTLVDKQIINLETNIEDDTDIEQLNVGDIISVYENLENYANNQNVKRVTTLYVPECDDDGNPKSTSVAAKEEIYCDNNENASFIINYNNEEKILSVEDYTYGNESPIIYDYSYDEDNISITRNDEFIRNEKTSEDDGISKTQINHKFKDILGNELENNTYYTIDLSDESKTVSNTVLINGDEVFYESNENVSTDIIYSNKYDKNILSTTISNENQSTTINMSNDFQNKKFKYVYNKAGNITQILLDDKIISEYSYDGHGRLVSEKNYVINEEHEYQYNSTGNIWADWKYKLDEDGNRTNEDAEVTYSEFDNELWSDQLTSYDGNSIEYDAMGNPTKYINGEQFEWCRGRVLSKILDGENTVAEYKYNQKGYRTYKKTSNQEVFYYWTEGQLTREKIYYSKSNRWYDLWYLYDASGSVIGYEYSNIDDLGVKLSNRIYYEKNIQGDVIALLDSRGIEIALYSYDAWGNIIDSTCYEGNEVAYQLNSITYRGYYRDKETGFYYLQSRYYDSEIKRFINADGYENLGKSGSRWAYNLYIYCEGEPVGNTDPNGCSLKSIQGIGFYNSQKNIFYYSINAPQRAAGYCSLFDYGSGLLTFDIAWLDVRFSYDSKEWRIELWKGIYGQAYGFGMSSGAEIGVYYRKWYYLYGWYQCADNANCLAMSYDLYNGNTKIYSRNSSEKDNYKGKHWWLTGFRVGIKKKPSQLTMKNVKITLKSETMAKNFEKSLKKAKGNKNSGNPKNISRNKSIVKFDW